jgi:hypothetical protein
MRLRLVPPLRPALPRVPRLAVLRVAEAVRVPFAAVRPRLGLAALVVRLVPDFAPLLRDAVLAAVRFGALFAAVLFALRAAVLRVAVLRVAVLRVLRPALAAFPRVALALARVPVAFAREAVALPRVAEALLARVPAAAERPPLAEALRVPFAAVERVAVLRAVPLLRDAAPEAADLPRPPALARPPFAAAAVRPAAPRAAPPVFRPDDADELRFAAPVEAERVDLARVPVLLLARRAGLLRRGFWAGCSAPAVSPSVGVGVCSISSLMSRSSLFGLVPFGAGFDLRRRRRRTSRVAARHRPPEVQNRSAPHGRQAVRSTVMRAASGVLPRDAVRAVARANVTSRRLFPRSDSAMPMNRQ